MKLITKQKEFNNNDDYIQFLYEASKKAIITWNKVEENNTDEIKKLMNDYLEGNRFIPIEEWENTIYKEAIKRLFRNDKIPETIISKEKLKAPNIINLISNAPKHIIEEFLKKIKRKREENFGMSRIVYKIIMKYIILMKISIKNIKEINEPDINDKKSLIEYKQIENLAIYVSVLQITDNNEEKVKDIIDKLIRENKNKKIEELKITNEITQLINDTRNKIMKVDKKEINLLELALEKIDIIIDESSKKEKVKKRGRPKKENIEDINQKKIDEYYNISIQMDLDEN